MKTNIKIENAVKIFGENVIIPNLSIDINEGEFFTLLGASGCGKTTLLRMIAGFNTIEGGNFYFGDKKINDIPAHKRNIGMVFQNYAIFPHMNTFDNVGFGLKNQKKSKDQIEKLVVDILEKVQITELSDRMPQKMSGGQQQRVALARAIVIKPDVLLMDEPLSNLDAKLRIEMRHVIKDIQNEFKITTVYVTHDQEEALAISDRIAIMKDGEILQTATPEKVYLQPNCLYVATFIGRSNVIKVNLLNDYIDFGVEYKFFIGNETKTDEKYHEALLMIRPHELRINRENGLQGVIIQRVFLGEVVQFRIRLNNGIILEVDSSVNDSLDYKLNEKVRIEFNPANLNLFDIETEMSILKRVDYWWQKVNIKMDGH